MRVNGACVQSIAKIAAVIGAAGFSAALGTHALLQTIGSLGAGAAVFERHEHGAVGPTMFVELALLLALAFIAIREIRATHGAIARDARIPVGRIRFGALALGIALVATATLFGMEVSESAQAATGLGWLGGSLFPGAPVLALTIAAVFGALKFVLDGRVAGLERLIELFSKIFVAIAAFADRPLLVHRRPVPLPIAVRSGFGRSAGLRAPPRFHY